MNEKHLNIKLNQQFLKYEAILSENERDFYLLCSHFGNSGLNERLNRPRDYHVTIRYYINDSCQRKSDEISFRIKKGMSSRIIR